MTFQLDPDLRPYATDSQWDKLQTLESCGSERKAADALGIHRRNISAAKKAVLAKAVQHGYSPDHDMTHPIPDGYRLRGTSTLYDQNGDPKIQWVKSERDKDRQHEIFLEIVEELTCGLPRVDPLPEPKITTSDLMACYPVGDHHLGMLSWNEETDIDYDLKIGEHLLRHASSHLINSSPACDKAAIVFLGDFMHYDSFVPVTPTSKNQLDADSRFPKMVRASIRCMRYMIERALLKHKEVSVIVEIGNHDLSSSIFLMECLANVYENEDRIHIDTSPKHYHYFQFGQCLIGTHHGHGAKMDKLPLIMAHDQPEAWGATSFRYWWTGHIHKRITEDFIGCTVESFRVLAAPDAWSHQKGYRPHQDMKSIILHKEYGETARNTVNPRMFT